MSVSFINTSGNIISEDFCSQLLIDTKSTYIRSKSFGDDVKRIDEDIATTFELLRERWEEIRTKVQDDKFDNTQLRNKWIIPFLDLLGFSPVYNSSNLKNDAGLEYRITYKGWDAEDAPLIHMINSRIDLDKKDEYNRTHSSKSPHDILQQFLNTSHHKWAIVTNGKKIRIVRKFFHSITKGFLEFDIEGIFESARTQEFRILYKILHSSRFIGQYKHPDSKEKDDCLLERFHKESIETGVKVGDNLRKQVKIAIESFGNGFAQNLNPDDFDDDKVRIFYSEILNIIYRLLFLLFAEQKGWLPIKNEVYTKTYSVNYLRERAEFGEYSFDNNEDLWEGLKITFQLVTKGYKFSNGDEINAFGGQLFSDERIFHIKSPLKNKHLLKAIDALSFFRDKNIKNKINYARLAIDELGSVYESLLDYEPRFLKEDTKIDDIHCKRGQFVLDSSSMDRKTSGSYYTDSRLVAQLIDSALVPVIENAIKDKDDTEKRNAILDLKVADIACGSGAFLIAALEKLGEHVALIGKDKDEKPTEDDLRKAKRDVLLNCIYGVDLNPMALELAKFSLWITASMPDMPLTFLDHKLKCGNSLIGATPELIKNGIPAEAYNSQTLDNSEVCNILKAKVKKELKELEEDEKGTPQLKIDFKPSKEEKKLDDQRKYIYKDNQETIGRVAEIEELYFSLEKQEREFKEWLLADTWTSSFFITKDDIDIQKYPTNLTLLNISTNQNIEPDLLDKIHTVQKDFNFFHWHLEFPEVFKRGGFDCILGNPPWEQVQMEEEEFFLGKDSEIAATKNASKRKQKILELKDLNNSLYQLYNKFLDQSNKLVNYIKNSKHSY